MKPIDLIKTLKKYKTGWVAINKKNNTVVAHAQSFEMISKAVKGNKYIYIMPASEDYFGTVV